MKPACRYEPPLVVHGDGKPEGAEAAIAELLALPKPPTAVFFYNDMSALGAMRQIRHYGLRIPSDISVVGFDDLYISQYLDPAADHGPAAHAADGRMAMEVAAANICRGRIGARYQASPVS